MYPASTASRSSSWARCSYNSFHDRKNVSMNFQVTLRICDVLVFSFRNKCAGSLCCGLLRIRQVWVKIFSVSDWRFQGQVGSNITRELIIVVSSFQSFFNLFYFNFLVFWIPYFCKIIIYNFYEVFKSKQKIFDISLKFWFFLMKHVLAPITTTETSRNDHQLSAISGILLLHIPKCTI